jgi:hypothetical protein
VEALTPFLNLLALVVVVAVVVVATLIIRRCLPLAAAAVAGEPVCLGCGTPARLLPADSFLCPVCKRDVRERGVGFRNPGAFATPIWRVLVFSALFCVVSIIATSLVIWVLLPEEKYTSVTQSVTPHENETGWLLNFNAVRRQVGRGPMEGELYADLLSSSGELVTLEVLGPSLRYRIIDLTRMDSAPPSEGTLDESAVLRWMSAAKLNIDGEDTRTLARYTYWKIGNMLGQDAPTPLQTGEGGGIAFASSGGSSFSGWSGSPPKYAVPTAMIIWPLLWLAGLLRIIRECRPNPQSATSSKGAPA